MYFVGINPEKNAQIYRMESSHAIISLFDTMRCIIIIRTFHYVNLIALARLSECVIRAIVIGLLFLVDSPRFNYFQT